MGTALILIGFVALVAVVVVAVIAVIAVVRRIRRRPARPLGRVAATLGVAALVLMTSGGALSPVPSLGRAGPTTSVRPQTATVRAAPLPARTRRMRQLKAPPRHRPVSHRRPHRHEPPRQPLPRRPPPGLLWPPSHRLGHQERRTRTRTQAPRPQRCSHCRSRAAPPRPGTPATSSGRPGPTSTPTAGRPATTSFAATWPTPSSPQAPGATAARSGQPACTHACAGPGPPSAAAPLEILTARRDRVLAGL